ncbi:ubiquitin thioesterase trabid isoform X1 [Schistocerca gregaria]|uniref:ubiquitin thioesterase trabid isoform X1 n=2 Tax=Schistocerca gregaria TaxID=7010 RepID=UPI00211DB9E4|nr:ubiquitin thioesterase trabid isoform X1 [Schistocerca gregaria]
MSCDPPTTKWVCEYCTYENWPSSLKCTMCRGAKPLFGEDIYKLRDDSPPTSLIDPSCGPSLASGSSHRDTHRSANNGKWECRACTYLNWPKALQCTQCRSPRPGGTNLHEHIQPLKIGQKSDTSAVTSASSLAGGPLRILSPSSESREVNESENVKVRSSDKSHSTRQQIIKWTCSTCTYENWPKALNCIMCGTPHGGNNALASGGKSNLAPTHRHSGTGSVVSSPERELSLITASRGGGNQAQLIEESGISKSKSNSRRSERTQTATEAAVAAVSPNNCEYERRVKRIRQRMREADWSWLDACIGVVEGDPTPVEAYLSSGGNPTRQLSPREVALLNRPSAFDTGHTLVHLAIRFHREDMLAALLSQIEGSGSGVKRVPSYVAPDLAADIRRHMASTLRQRKGSIPCYYVTELTTFALPAEVEDLPQPVQEQLFEELLDRDAQQQLESEPAAINWSLEVTDRLGSRLYALWNRSAGDCLLDSAMQATWGVFDRDNTLRRALADSLHQAGHIFYPRWKEYEAIQAQMLDFSLEEGQWEEDWAGLLSLASQPGASLEQLHVFALAHILRRPIVVYGVKYVKSFRGETIGFARFEGVYLPLLWDPSFCIRSPIALGYTRGHFSALVPVEQYSPLGAGAGANNLRADEVTFLPLTDRDRKLLPVHFLTQTEVGHEDAILRQWMDVCHTEGGIMVAQQHLHKRPLLVAQMLEEWLNHYRRLVQVANAPFVRPTPIQDYSSDGGETDDE